MDEFLKRCFYHSGQYDSEENFSELDKKLKGHEVIGDVGHKFCHNETFLHLSMH